MSLFRTSDDFFTPSCSLDELLMENRISTYLFRMKGGAKYPHLFDGDILVVDRSKTPIRGDLVVVERDGTFVVDEFSNSLGEVLIFGVVKFSIREFDGKNRRTR